MEHMKVSVAPRYWTELHDRTVAPDDVELPEPVGEAGPLFPLHPPVRTTRINSKEYRRLIVLSLGLHRKFRLPPNCEMRLIAPPEAQTYARDSIGRKHLQAPKHAMQAVGA